MRALASFPHSGNSSATFRKDTNNSNSHFRQQPTVLPLPTLSSNRVSTNGCGFSSTYVCHDLLARRLPYRELRCFGSLLRLSRGRSQVAVSRSRPMVAGGIDGCNYSHSKERSDLSDSLLTCHLCGGAGHDGIRSAERGADSLRIPSEIRAQSACQPYSR